MRVVDLLNQKNHYLEKFYALNESEISVMAQGEFENLNSFYQTREQILEVIQYIDRQLFEENSIHALDFEEAEMSGRSRGFECERSIRSPHPRSGPANFVAD